MPLLRDDGTGVTFLSCGVGGGHLLAGADSVSADRLVSFGHNLARRNERSAGERWTVGRAAGGAAVATAGRVASVAVYK